MRRFTFLVSHGDCCRVLNSDWGRRSAKKWRHFSYGFSDCSVISWDQTSDWAIAETKVNLNSLVDPACTKLVNPLEISYAERISNLHPTVNENKQIWLHSTSICSEEPYYGLQQNKGCLVNFFFILLYTVKIVLMHLNKWNSKRSWPHYFSVSLHSAELVNRSFGLRPRLSIQIKLWSQSLVSVKN